MTIDIGQLAYMSPPMILILEGRNFDTIKYATYRTAAKLFYIQSSTNSE